MTITICALNQFQLTAARRRLEPQSKAQKLMVLFQLTAARRRLGALVLILGFIGWFQLTAARRRLAAQAYAAIPADAFQLTAARRRLASCCLFSFVSDGKSRSLPLNSGDVTKLKYSSNSRDKSASWELCK